ncbi:hypothetical protein C1645_766249 [Glomus cerebriforme]|uniref:Survival Motor Neuron Gemin2-binding domain-containing protein n=1 Tax=Glomus cerebriforme TaxID=658196 RepID=A0A397T6X3_9GLOM|nr:hypothetical protein C1645_766249 [Glomus cerebriforme]
MSTYFEFSESSSAQEVTSQDSRVPIRYKPMDIYGEDNEYYEDEVEDAATLEEGDEEDGDVWDDSALIAAWDIAVKEYQATNRIEVLENFHSIKANKTDTKNDTTSNSIPTTSSNNKAIKTEKSVNIVKEESFDQQDVSSALNEIGDAFASALNTSVKEQNQNEQKPPEQDIKKSKQIKSQTATGSSSILRDNSYQYQPTRTTATNSSYSHHFPGYYSYPPPSATSSTAPIPPHSFSEQFRGTMKSQEDQEESKLPPTEEATTSYSNTNVRDSYYNGEHYSSSAYNYYPPPPPPPPEFYPPHPSSMPTNPNIPFPGWGPKPPDMAPPMPGFDDEAFTNLIMAWYYSGYYTGLHHGRKGR